MAITEQKILLKKCKEVLNSGDNQYSDEEVLQIRDFLYVFANIEVNFYLEKVANSQPEVKKQVTR